MYGRALGVAAKGANMLVDVMRSPCRRPPGAAPRLVAVLALCAGSVLSSEAARAQPAAPPSAAPSILQQADAAFQRGLALLEQGHYKEACEQFELSQLLDPSPGTQLNLGNCREQEGDLVQALATFEQALEGARAARDPRRRQLWSEAARERIVSLSPRVPLVSIRGVSADARVTIDERAVDAAASPLRINPGPHHLVVSAPGMRAFVQSFESTPGQQLTIDVPPLEPEPMAPAALESGSRYGAWPYVLGGVGAVLLGTSVVTGLAASAASDELERACTDKLCNPSLRSTRDRADRLATLTDVFWITGALAAGAGVTLFVLDLGREEGAPALEAGCFGSGCGLRASGRF